MSPDAPKLVLSCGFCKAYHGPHYRHVSVSCHWRRPCQSGFPGARCQRPWVEMWRGATTSDRNWTGQRSLSFSVWIIPPPNTAWYTFGVRVCVCVCVRVFVCPVGALTSESPDLENSFLVSRYNFRISTSSSCIRVIRSRSRSQEQINGTIYTCA